MRWTLNSYRACVCSLHTLYEHVLIDTVSVIRTGCAHNGGGVAIIAKSSETCRTQGQSVVDAVQTFQGPFNTNLVERLSNRDSCCMSFRSGINEPSSINPIVSGCVN